MNKIVYRHGDVGLRKATRKDAEWSAKGERVQPVGGRLVLAEGETTGHTHSMDAATCELFRLPEGMVLVVREETPLVHQEHAPINVAPGTYWVVGQREYSPEAIRRVMD